MFLTGRGFATALGWLQTILFKGSSLFSVEFILEESIRSNTRPHPNPLPQERGRGHGIGNHRVDRRVWLRYERGTMLQVIEGILRAPSPGGEGWGEGEPCSMSLKTARNLFKDRLDSVGARFYCFRHRPFER